MPMAPFSARDNAKDHPPKLKAVRGGRLIVRQFPEVPAMRLFLLSILSAWVFSLSFGVQATDQIPAVPPVVPAAAVDVAEYFSHQPRPDFPDKVKDWPKDRKSEDSR